MTTGSGATAAPLRRRFFRLALVNILSNVTVPLAGLVDTAMLGHLPDIRFLAGVALASLLFDYIYWTFGFLRMGTTGTTAQAVGRSDRKQVYLTLYRSLMIALGVSALILAFQLPLRELGFGLLAGEPGVEAAGRAYFDARVWGAPATLCNFALVGWFLGREESRYVLVVTVVANLANVLFNYVFIIRMGLAAQGAGLATMVSQYLAVATSITIFFACGPRWPWRWTEVAASGELGRLFRLNRDILARTLCLVTAFALFTNFSSLLGTAVLAANSILLRLLSVASYLIDGAAFASESLAGIFLGQRDLPSLRRLVRLSLAAGLGFGALVLAIFFAAPRSAFGVLTSHADLIELSLAYLPWLAPVVAIGSFAYMYDGLFLGLTEGRRLRNSMLFSLLVVFLPTALLALRLENNDLLWGAMALFMAARSGALWLALRHRLSDFAADWRC